MCNKVNTDGLRTKWVLVVLGMINATSLAIYLHIQILVSGNYLLDSRGEKQVTGNRDTSATSNADFAAKPSAALRTRETAVAHPYKAKIKFDGYEFEFILRELTFGEAHTLASDEYSVVHTCGYSLLNKDQLRRVEQ